MLGAKSPDLPTSQDTYNSLPPTQPSTLYSHSLMPDLSTASIQTAGSSSLASPPKLHRVLIQVIPCKEQFHGC